MYLLTINASTSEEINLKVIRNDNELEFFIKPETITEKDSLDNEIKKKVLGIKIVPLYNEFNNESLDQPKLYITQLKKPGL